MKLPTAEDVIAGLPEGHQINLPQAAEALLLAPDVLEYLTGTPILERTVQENIFLRDRPEPLSIYPARNVTASGRTIQYTPATGILHPENIPPYNYLVTYVVGYGRDDLPAIVVNGILHLVRHHLLKSEEDRETAAAEIAVMRIGREKLRRERAREYDEAGRAYRE